MLIDYHQHLGDGIGATGGEAGEQEQPRAAHGVPRCTPKVDESGSAVGRNPRPRPTAPAASTAALTVTATMIAVRRCEVGRTAGGSGAASTSLGGGGAAAIRPRK